MLVFDTPQQFEEECNIPEIIEWLAPHNINKDFFQYNTLYVIEAPDDLSTLCGGVFQEPTNFDDCNDTAIAGWIYVYMVTHADGGSVFFFEPDAVTEALRGSVVVTAEIIAQMQKENAARLENIAIIEKEKRVTEERQRELFGKNENPLN
jgi:hypothetical protein